MTPAKDINNRRPSEIAREVSRSLSLSTSPIAVHSQTSSYGASHLGRAVPPSASSIKLLKPFATQDIKILLLENINQTGQDILSKQGYQVEALKSSLPEDQLIEKIKFVFPGIFSYIYIYMLLFLTKSLLQNPWLIDCIP